MQMFRYAGGNGKLIPVSDLNFDTGAKITGEVPVVDNVAQAVAQYLGINTSETLEENWFDREGGAEIVDVSKWNGIIDWDLLWSRVHGAIIRAGYGSITDQRYLEYLPGFITGSEDQYKAIYHYMNNTGVSVSNQVDCILRAIDNAGPENIHAFWSDVEHAYNDASLSSFRTVPEQIMRSVKSEFPHLTVGFYTNYQGWSDLGAPTEWLDEFLFWYAWYPYNHLLAQPKPPGNLSVGDIYLWQYWAGGNNMGSHYGCSSSSIDVNISRDSSGEFLAENLHDYDLGEIIVPSEDKILQMKAEQELMLAGVKAHSDKMIELAQDEPEPMYTAVVTVNALNVRGGPGISYSKVGSLAQDTEVSVWREMDGDGYTWAKIDKDEEMWVANSYLKEN